MYETGERIPSTYVYQSMADLFNVDLDYIMGRSDKITVLPERLDYENRISKNTNRVLASMRRLNDDGQGRVADYAEDLCATERYKRPEREISHVIDFIAEPQALYTLGTAAAGSGFYNEDYIENYRLIMTTEIPEHDFTLDVEGNSIGLYLNGAKVVQMSTKKSRPRERLTSSLGLFDERSERSC